MSSSQKNPSAGAAVDFERITTLFSSEVASPQHMHARPCSEPHAQVRAQTHALVSNPPSELEVEVGNPTLCRGGSSKSWPECPSPPPGCSWSDGEWVWMTAEDWRVLEEFTDAAQGASEIMKEQRGALEAQADAPKNGGFATYTGEEVLLKELQQMRLQLAAAQEEKSRLEQHNAELLKNCHFLHSQNMELKQKKSTRPRLNLGSSLFPSRAPSPLSQSSTCSDCSSAETQ